MVREDIDRTEYFKEDRERRINPNSVVCDSSSLISLTDAGLLGALMMLRKEIKGDLIITEGVIDESINTPIKKPEYAFSAIRIKRALKSGAFRIGKYEKSTYDEILRVTNNMFYTDRPFHLVNHGEAEMLATAIDNKVGFVLMDERTTRMLIESPFELKKHIENEFRIKMNINDLLFRRFREMTAGINVIRSSEILALAKSKGYFKKFGDLEREAYKAALYALKFNGCSISFEEIEELSRIV
ncbi:MAG: hypothetical protein QXO35_01855 [Candidatus Micrarchaeia archaeon]